MRKVPSLVQLLLAAPCVLAARLLRPLILIRFGALPSARAHFTSNIEVYLCERDAGLHGRRVIDLFYYVQSIYNQQLKTMWDRALPISRVFRWAARVNGCLPGGEPHVVPWGREAGHDIHGLLAETKPHLSFTLEEERRGWAALRELGVSPEVPFVGMHAKDPAFRNRDLPTHHPDRHKHNCLDSRIETFLPAAEMLVRRGYTVFRMGALVEQPLQTTNPRVIDYATTVRTDFLDVFLCAHCRFFLGDTGGIIGIPHIFRRPLALVNLICLEAIWTHNPYDLLIFKGFWLRSEHRFLTLQETMGSELAGRLGNFELDEYERRGIDVIDNTPEEITALVLEMDARLNGTWETTDEDEELQRRLWVIYQDGLHVRFGQGVHRVLRARVGAAFLRQHQAWLLEPHLPSGPLTVSMR